MCGGGGGGGGYRSPGPSMMPSSVRKFVKDHNVISYSIRISLVNTCLLKNIFHEMML